ncbi:MAG: DedA family protein [Gammaproteobacteria bacterium]|nr:DedA family protein [Gammaproteobacteria bacterium]
MFANELLGLFVSAFISSTLFPGGSEAVLIYLYAHSPHSYVVLVVVATIGNTLGAMTSWGIGRFLAWRFPQRSHTDKSQQAIARLSQYGSPVLLLSWLPIIGDPLCVAAGWLRIHWLKALLFILVGKLLRYWFVLEAVRVVM